MSASTPVPAGMKSAAEGIRPLNARVAVVVLNWNGRDDTLACLESLRSQTVPIRIVVVDNGSEDDSVAAIRRGHPEVMLIETGCNLGYTGGNNAGITRALAEGATHVLVLNNDTLLDPDCIAALLAESEAAPHAAAFAPKTLFQERPDTIYFAGGRITRRGAAHHIGLGETDGPAHDRAGPTDWITGCALFAPRQTFERVGLFDDRFFLLFEDVDWSLRVRESGSPLWYAPSARLWHRGSRAFGGKRGAVYQYYNTRNGLLCLQRHRPALLLLPSVLLFLSDAWGRIRRLSGFPSERALLRDATLQGIGDYLAGRFGKGGPQTAGRRGGDR